MKGLRIQLIIHLIKHGTNLTSIALDNVSIFQTASRKNTKKNGCKFANCKCELYGMYKKIYGYIFWLYKKKLTASQPKQTTTQTETKHQVINLHKKKKKLAQNSNKT